MQKILENKYRERDAYLDTSIHASAILPLSLPAAACALPTVNNSVNLVGHFVHQSGLLVYVFTVECGMGYYVAPSATSGRCSGPGGEFSMVPRCESKLLGLA